MNWTRCATLAALLCLGADVAAQGHGPAYALSTPTLGAGGWSLDIALMARWSEAGTNSMVRPMFSYGITEDVQLSVSVPAPLTRAAGSRPARMATRMPATRDVEALGAWRFHRRAIGVGSRVESTAYAGVDYPLDERRAGTATAPGMTAALVTGYASRSTYAWIGALARRYGAAGGDRIGDVAMYSLALGYRPARFRKELPHADWRIFLEVVGETARPNTIAGTEQPGSGSHEVFLGPTVLGLFGAWGISGGPMFRIHREQTEPPASDRVRLAVNTTFWF
ncbi:MAG: hypothetical protein ACRELD_11995 [Longimicrobiales bacterium]